MSKKFFYNNKTSYFPSINSPTTKSPSPAPPLSRTYSGDVGSNQNISSVPLRIQGKNLEYLEAFVLENPEHMLQAMPDINLTIIYLLQKYPDSYKEVWNHLKPILYEARKQSQIHGELIDKPVPPVPKPRPVSWENIHGEQMVDDFAHFTDREDPEVVEYLDQENKYSQEALEHTKVLQRVLFKEFVSRIDENEESPKISMPDGYTYYTKRIEGYEYPVHCRSDSRGIEAVYLNENDLKHPESDEKFMKVGFIRHSHNTPWFAYGVDISGNERYSVYLKNKDTLEQLPEVIENVSEGVEFSNCGQYVFYLNLDDCERAWQLKRHKLGTSVDKDVVLYEELDEMFFLVLSKSCSGKYIFVNSSAQITSETRFIPADAPLKAPQIVFKRQVHVNYITEHHGAHFYILTNDGVKNNFLFRVPIPADPVEQSNSY
jgi:oligopeptidase B